MNISNIKSSILSIPRNIKRFIVILIDINIIFFSVWFAYYLRIGEFIFLWNNDSEYQPLFACILSVLLYFFVFFSFDLYKIIFRYSGSNVIISIAKALSLYGLLYFTIFTVVGVKGVPRTIGILQPLILFLLVICSRFLISQWLSSINLEQLKTNTKRQALIYGAGDTGFKLAKALLNSSKVNVVGFLDDNKTLQGNKINNLYIYNPNDIDELIRQKNIREVVIALPSNKNLYRNIFNNFREKNLILRILPKYEDLLDKKINQYSIRNLTVNDILGRSTIAPNPTLMRTDIYQRVVLISGAGGSIGGELCRQISTQKPKTIIVLDHNEFGVYNIVKELKALRTPDNAFNIICSICSVTNKNAIKELLNKTKPETIFHAAAYKHVSLVEKNKIDGLYNNIFGTLVMSQTAINFKVKKFVLISTDKAVNPSNIMGASKRLSEMILQALSVTQNKTLFSIVRFGNVLGSSGSVLPLFQSQIALGGPVTVRHREVKRYFMTISEAAQLVIQANAMLKPTSKLNQTARIYILDMGEPVKIYDLAKLMIELSGLKVYDNDLKIGDIKIDITGLMPGEKLNEELYVNKLLKNTKHPKIKFANENFSSWEDIKPILSDLKKNISIRNEKQTLENISKLLSLNHT